MHSLPLSEVRPRYRDWLIVVVAAVLVSCSRPAVRPFPERPNVLLITVDTLRADHLSSYGYPRSTSPRLDRLAAEGVRFDRAIVQWPKTGPSFASMFTSTYPKDNGIVRRIGIPVPSEMRLLAEDLRDLGYATRAVVANGALSSKFGFGRGFERYVESWMTPPPGDGGERLDPDGATRVTDLALDLLAGLAAERDATGGARPYFLWVHYLDPHFPYAPPPAFRDRFQGDEHWDGTVEVEVDASKPARQMLGIGPRQVLEGHKELDFYVARYDAEIAYVDFEIGRLVDAVAEHGLDQRTLTIVSSDHGESLGEHQYYFDHGRFAFQTCARVPLILHFPQVLAPRVDLAPVELIDLSPTVLEIAGAALAEGTRVQGQSFIARLLEGPAEGEHLAFTEAGHAAYRRWQKAVQDQRFKLVLAPSAPESKWLAGNRITLFDLTDDPGETADASERHPDARRRLESAMRDWLRARPNGQVSERQQELKVDKETLEQLRSLGYID